MTNRDKSPDRYPGAPRNEAASPEDIDALGEQEEMARLMKSLRDSIPFHEEEPQDAYGSDDPEPAGERPPLPERAGRDLGAASVAGTSDEDDFARLLRTLREGIPDEDVEPQEPADALASYDPHRYEPPDADARPYAARKDEAPPGSAYDTPYDPSPLRPHQPVEDYAAEDYAATEEADEEGEEEGDEGEEESEEAYDFLDADQEPYAPPEAPLQAGDGMSSFAHLAAHPLHNDEHHALDVSPGEQAVIADLLRSIQGEDHRPDSEPSAGAQRRAAGPQSDPADDYDEEDRADRGQAWKIALALSCAAGLGLVIALVNPFGDKTQPQVPNRVVVPLPPPPAPRPSTQMAELKPVVIPSPPAAMAPPVAMAPPKPEPPPVPAPPPVAALPPKPEPPPPPAAKPVAAPPQVAALPPVAVPPPPPQPAPPPVAPPPAPKPEPAKPEPAKIVPPKAEAPKPPPPKPEPVKPVPVIKAKPVEVAEPQIAPEERVAAAAGAPPPTGPRMLTVQVGSFKIADNADRLIKLLKGQGFDAYGKDWTDRHGQLWHVVRVGRISERDRAAAASLAQKLRGRPEKETFVFSVQAQ